MLSIGERLKRAREARKLSIKKASEATRLSTYYIEALEADDLSILPSAVQARGFLRLYADFLGLDTDELLERQKEHPAEEATGLVGPLPSLQSSPQPDSSPEEESPPPAKTVPSPPQPETPAITEADHGAPEAESEPEAKQPARTTVSRLQSQVIFNEIGQQLRGRRELLSLTLDEIERHTRVRKNYLMVIESGRFDEIPSPVQARGMLSAYASFLDMDSEAMLLRFADALQARRLERQPAQPSASARPRMFLPFWLRRFVSPDLIFGGGMIVILIGLTLWGAARLLSSGAASPLATQQAPSISDVLLSSPIATFDLTEVLPTSVAELGTPNGDQTSEASSTPILSGGSAVQITAIITERTYLRVTVDGQVAEEDRVAPGAALSFEGNDSIEVLTGSGSGIQIIYNQQNLGVMGNFGEVVDRVYTSNGVETPTSTPSPTPTITMTPTLTPKPSLTPRFSPVPSRTPTPTITATP